MLANIERQSLNHASVKEQWAKPAHGDVCCGGSWFFGLVADMPEPVEKKLMSANGHSLRPPMLDFEG